MPHPLKLVESLNCQGPAMTGRFWMCWSRSLPAPITLQLVVKTLYQATGQRVDLAVSTGCVSTAWPSLRIRGGCRRFR